MRTLKSNFSLSRSLGTKAHKRRTTLTGQELADYSLGNFMVDVEAAAAGSNDEGAVMRSLKPKLEALITGPRPIPPSVFVPREDRFAMNLVYKPKDESFSIIAAVWKPGQTTPIHDHLTWAMIGTYSGQEREAIFRRRDDTSNPAFAKLEKVSERTNEKGHVTVLGRSGIHRVDNVGSEPALSIHVYGRDIGPAERHSYDPVTGEISKFVSGYCNVIRDTDDF
jgi:predicted metal-dependent enzyme (double-stranded beta helix superfamily)